ncbi:MULTISPECIES: HlyD family efflux transporter periplasmic adaptor subunit [unclassified Sphingomonas]|uniref:HlyD family efflux transporter periplasmic adaptor subunit n=1 Tax=Sphingomonas TaxID=13687 RepID=UPI0009645CCD|nr:MULTISPECIES: HlyD family efflux transporter periplasmic adaptor subunit [unclassified Sphingomonas]MBN8810258.1 HlyD family efflux transporter periplasmic adaptor subunit [Sphingomonas sp.]OJY50816.1 MAG: secretion protein HlyD [Sphingomonas sp. 67-41]
MNRRRIAILVVIVVLVIAAIATSGFGLFKARDDGALRLNGNVDIREVDLGFRVSGRIAAIGVEEGAHVKQGQLLATLDAATLDSRIAQADAQVSQAEAQLAKLRNGNRAQDIAQARARVDAAAAVARDAERDYARRQPLVEPGAISRDVWEQTVATRDKARADLAQARQALSLMNAGSRKEDVAAAAADVRSALAARQGAATDLGDARLLASTDGTIVTRAREPGAIVQPGETVLTLAILRPLRVRAYVAESDLSRIGPGMKVTVTADGNPKDYHGTIGYISPRAEFTPKTVETENLRTDLVYQLRIIVDDPDDALRQGQPVSVSVPGARPKHKD